MSDVSTYCREVEAHLTRVNGGHLVRVVGPGFVLVRSWAEEGVPLSIVFKAIEHKAERHKAGRAGRSGRPLRIEFCAADVREAFEAWQHAIGLSASTGHDSASTESAPETGSRRPSASRVIDKAIDRLGRLAGRLELPEAFRDGASQAIEELSDVRQALTGLRGQARAPWLERLPPIERALLEHARQAMDVAALDVCRAEAEQELSGYRDRMSEEAWTKAVDVTVARAVRDHFGLPTLEV